MSKSYVELECPNIKIISEKIYNFVATDELLAKRGWVFIDTKAILTAVPELLDFFKQYNLLPRNAAVTVLTKTGDLPMHLDELPIVAKINMPVKNTSGWVNRWYHINPELIATCPQQINQFGSTVENLENIPNDQITIVDELYDFQKPIVFNSRIPHSVDKITDGKSIEPRIIASFTFYNDTKLMDLLK